MYFQEEHGVKFYLTQNIKWYNCPIGAWVLWHWFHSLAIKFLIVNYYNGFFWNQEVTGHLNSAKSQLNWTSHITGIKFTI